MWYPGSIAGFDGYFTVGQLAKNQHGEPVYLLDVIPEEIAPTIRPTMSRDELEDCSIIRFSAAQKNAESFSVGASEPAPGTTAFAALQARDRIIPTDNYSDSGERYQQVVLDDRHATTNALQSELARRLTLWHGAVPEITVEQRDTGARAGDRQARTYSPELIETYFSKPFAVQDYVTTPHGRKAITERLASLFKGSDVKTFN